jgi:hypothetical protein
MCSWTQHPLMYYTTPCANAMIWCKCVMFPTAVLSQIWSLNNLMLRVVFIYILLTTAAMAFHENTFAVFELKEQLQILYINMWELLTQLEYVTPDQRRVVYEEMEHIRQQITDTIDLLRQHDQSQHP